MKKTLIALALTALPVAAMADVTLYGQIKGGINVENKKVTSVGNTSKATYDGQTSAQTIVRDYGSRIGFKGEEDLGNGLKTIWQVEQSVSLGGNTGGKDGTGWSNRQTFIGLEGAFGKIRVGNLDNVFKSDMEEMDPWEYDADGNTSSLGLAQFTRVDQRFKASLRYDTPDFAGFSGSLQYATKADQAALDGKWQKEVINGPKSTIADANGNFNSDFTTTHVVDGKVVPLKNKGSDAWFLGLNYENSGFFAKYGFGQYSKNAISSDVSYVRNATTGGMDRHRSASVKNTQVHRLNVGYDANNLFVSGSYQYTRGFDSLAGLRSDFGDLNSTSAIINNTLGQASSIATHRDVNQAIQDYADAANDGVKRSELALTAAYTMGAITPRITYAHGFDMKTLGNYGKLKNTKYDQIIVGADYALSKRTTALVSAGWLRQGLGYSYTLENNDAAKVTEHKDKYKNTSFSVGLRHKF